MTRKRVLRAIAWVLLCLSLAAGWPSTALAAPAWERLWGKNAYDTMFEVVGKGDFATGGTVVVATGEGYWDALAASGLAGRLGAPVLITPKASLAPQTRELLQRLSPSRIVVAGGHAAVSAGVVGELRSLCSKVEQVYGPAAPDTAVSLYKAGTGWGKTAIVATSDGYWDALSIAPYAYAKAAPIFLTASSSNGSGRKLPSSALDAIRKGGFDHVVIVGGFAAVSDAVEQQLSGLEVMRLAGKDALGTSAAIAKWELTQGMSKEHLCVATSNGYWDALTGASLAGSLNSVLVLMNPLGGSDAVDAVYSPSDTDVSCGYMLGGKAALSAYDWDYVHQGSWSDEALREMDIRRAMGSLTLEQKVAQLFVVKPEQLVGGSLVTSYDATLANALASRPVGGIILLGSNIVQPDQTRSLTSALQSQSRAVCGLPMFLCVDEEGGTVTRVAGDPAFGVQDPGNMNALGATGDVSLAQSEARRVGTYLRDLGFNVNFAPVADIAGGSYDFIWWRSFGTDANLVAQMVSAQVHGFAEAGIYCSAKHFPGIGGLAEDSHFERIESRKSLDQLRSWELVPFRAAIDSGVPMIMVGHLSCVGIDGGSRPASLSKAVVTSILRGEMGYDGLVITDSLGMGAVTAVASSYDVGVLALEAGCDLILAPADFDAAYQGVLDAVRSGRISQARIDESLYRVVSAKLDMA